MKSKSLSMLIGIFIMPVLFLSLSLNAQDKSYEQAKKEIIQEFGTMPIMFEKFPDFALAGAWETFKQLHSPEAKIPGKYRELLQLAVAAQIPCPYCIYFHTAMAKALGASEEELQEAVALGAETRHWSTILQGNQVEFEEFKAEFDAMMKYMAQKTDK
jgi:AhpD family alkylhydroperoxidase